MKKGLRNFLNRLNKNTKNLGPSFDSAVKLQVAQLKSLKIFRGQRGNYNNCRFPLRRNHLRKSLGKRAYGKTTPMRKKDSTTLVERLIAKGASIDPRRNIYLDDKPTTKRKQRIEGVSRFVASGALKGIDLGKPNLVNPLIYETPLRRSVDS